MMGPHTLALLGLLNANGVLASPGRLQMTEVSIF